MSTAQINFELCKIKIDCIADARGVNFNNKLKYVEMSMNSLRTGEVLVMYCSDCQHKDMIPAWLKSRGYLYLGTVNHPNYYKILIIKN